MSTPGVGELLDRDVAAAVDVLAASRTPYLIGVRHHSPALSFVLPRLLESVDPQVILLELPAEAQPWLQWLAHPDAIAPLAWAAATDDGPLSFYPFADFSPELVALRWARAHGVPVVACDRPVGASPDHPDGAADAATPSGRDHGPGLGDWLVRRRNWSDFDEAWDRLVEVHAVGAEPEQVRRAGLAVGLAHRLDELAQQPAAARDSLDRERWMRSALAEQLESGVERVAAVVGSFHASALLDLVGPAQTQTSSKAVQIVRASLVPYSHAQLDSRSGYPAGIRDPQWQQAVLTAEFTAAGVKAAATSLLTRIGALVRADGHPYGPGEIAETARMACDLAALRGLRAPGRRELMESLTSVGAHGEVLGRGRVVARAAEQVLVGDAHGRVADGTPRSALTDQLTGLLRDLGLPADLGPNPNRKPSRTNPNRQAGDEYRFEPVRGGLDARRVVTLHRMTAARIPYGHRLDTTGVGGVQSVTELWQLRFTAQTVAGMELAGVHGVRLVDVARALLRARLAREDAEGPTTAGILAGLDEAGRCALPDLARERLRQVRNQVVPTAGFAAVVSALRLTAGLRHGGYPGLTMAESLADLVATTEAELTSAAVRELEGLAGSRQRDDVRALVALAEFDRETVLRLTSALDEMLANGSALMQGAALGVLLRLERVTSAQAGARVSGWIGSAVGPTSRSDLRDRLAGFALASGVGLEVDPGLLAALADAVESPTDDRFVAVLPALRGGFDALSAADRDRLLTVLGAAHGRGRQPDTLDADPEELARTAAADTAARRRLAALGLADLAFSPAERWRLVLGRGRAHLSPTGGRLARSLDELYGNQGSGEGSQRRDPGLGGTEEPRPTTREWLADLDDLFGGRIREEVIGAAAAAGRADVAEHLDPQHARASIELLTTVLSLRGALSEERLARLRPLVRRLVEDLTKALANRLRPALAGLAVARPTRRDTGRLNLARTVESALGTAFRDEGGRLRVVPEAPVFDSRAGRQADWHIIVVVDVSGSMEPSTVFAALTAAVLSGVACLRVSFVTFSTQVIDLSEHTDDPLALLLEISVGGGTSIATGLAYARSLVTVPNRTLLALITDFEEGGPLQPMLAEVEKLHTSGVRLLGCAALDEAGVARYDVGAAQQVAAAGMRVAAVSPLELAHWVADVVNR